MRKKILALNDVCFSYHTKKGELLAIKDLSFDVFDGEFVSIVGPSGCGKTTVLSLISGLLRASSGEVSFKDDCRVGYMFQKDHLFEWRTIWKNILLGLEIQKKTKNKDDIAYAISLLKKYGIYEFKDKHPSQLSGGMKQRVALIRTLVLKPDLLLLDEPFSALDFQTRLKVCDDVYKIIKEEGKTAILVTHDISEAVSVSDKVVVLSKRPATTKKQIELNFDNAILPFDRRNKREFSSYFNEIWKELNET